MAPPPYRSTLLVQLFLPLTVFILISIALWSSAADINLVSANSLTTQVRFGPKDYCGYNVTLIDGKREYDLLGCIDAGWAYQVDKKATGVALPGAVSTSLSKGAVLLIWCFSAILLAAILQLYSTRYVLRKAPEPTKEGIYTLVSLNLLFIHITVVSLWITFIVIAVICGNGSAYKGPDRQLKLHEGGVRIWWGASPWLVLASAVIGLVWAFESVRWRHAELTAMK